MSEPKYIIAVDQSTTGTKAMLIDHDGNVLTKCYKKHRQILPQPGWVEHDPMELLRNVQELIGQVLQKSKVGSKQIQCLAITNQRETVLAWDKESGKPVYNAVVWQCNRAGSICGALREAGMEQTIREKTGLPLSEFFSGAKLRWIMDHVPEAAAAKKRGTLLCGTIDSWLVWNLSEEHRHVTDYSNASRTELFNLNTLCWDDELLAAFHVSNEMMPHVIFSDEVAGHMMLDGVSIPIAGLIGDSHGALFAQSGLGQSIKVTYGTGSSIMAGTGEQMVRCGRLATTVSYAFNHKVNLAIEGNINSTGATIKWVADKLGLMHSAAEAEELALQVPDNGGVFFVPAFIGLGAPHWDGAAKAVICGMTYNADRRHIVRAALESIAFQIEDVLEELKLGNLCPAELHVDGKPTENQFLMEFQAGISDRVIVKNRIEEASAYGTALMAGLATAYWELSDIPALVRSGAVIYPAMSCETRENLRKGWKKAIRMSMLKE